MGSGLTTLLARIAKVLGRRCPVCGKAVGQAGPCADCARELAPRLGGYCPACGTLYENPDEPPIMCFTCRDDPRPWSRLSFHGKYEGALRRLILQYKFSGALSQGNVLRGLLRDAYLRGRPQPDGEVMVAPVPLHPRRLIYRGFNQSLELARALDGLPGVTIAPEALRRVRHTTPQARLPQKERQANLKRAFEADPRLVAGRRVVLVDDVATTGSTLEWTAKALRRAGAAEVDCLVLARS